MAGKEADTGGLVLTGACQGGPAMRLIQVLWMRVRLLLVRGCVKAGHFFAALGERLRGF
jgi:hypothetical protein